MREPLRARKRIGIGARDHKKDDLVEWAIYNRQESVRHDLYATGTTGTILEDALGVGVAKPQSGPLGGDLRIGGLIADGSIDPLVFFWDPLESQPHDPDVRALLRVAVVWNVPVAMNRSTANFLISSPPMVSGYDRTVLDYQAHIARLATR